MFNLRLLAIVATCAMGLFTGCGDDESLPLCGNGVVESGEACDDGNNLNGDGCSASCAVEAGDECGDGMIQAPEVCDDGNTADGDGCSADCASDETCGNGVMDLDEECDDGNTAAGDACSPACMVEECGNDIVDAGEVCDDGNTTDGDGCSADCTSDETCGNDIMDTDEVCDDGNTMDGDGCSANCLSDETCGNEVTDTPIGEGCDDGNNQNGDGCNENCQLEGCGNDMVEPGEVCDDGNTTDGDGCSANCLSDETCGNDVVDISVGEVCDDNNTVDGDGCSANCLSDETCGNDIVDTSVGEVCDDNNTDDGDGCSANCLSDETCGNDVVDGSVGEQCDDGNVVTGDGCTSLCQTECVTDPDLAVLDDGSAANGAVGVPDLVMSEINPGDYIELWNTTGADIALGAVNHQLCARPAYRALSVLAPDVVVPANGYATIPWPANFIDADAGGEVMLYSGANFGNSTTILDFTCWGVNPHASRKTQAESVGKWSGACNLALSGGALHRNVSSTGIMAADYDVAGAPTPANCVVVP